jgi:hypothetical protein
VDKWVRYTDSLISAFLLRSQVWGEICPNNLLADDGDRVVVGWDAHTGNLGYSTSTKTKIWACKYDMNLVATDAKNEETKERRQRSTTTTLINEGMQDIDSSLTGSRSSGLVVIGVHVGGDGVLCFGYGRVAGESVWR